MATRKDIKELRKPDEFMLVVGQAAVWAQANWKPLAASVGALLVILAAVFGARAAQASREEQSAADLSVVLELAARPVVESKPSEENKEGTKDAAKDAAKDIKESFHSEDAKRKAVFEGLEKVRHDHAGSAAALTATLKLAEVKLAANDGAAAVPLFEGYLQQATTGSPFAPFAIEGLGYAYESQNKLDEAEKAFDRLATEGGDPGRGAYHHARMLASRGKIEEAKKAFGQVATTYEKDPIALEASTRAQMLNVSSAPAAAPAPSAVAK